MSLTISASPRARRLTVTLMSACAVTALSVAANVAKAADVPPATASVVVKYADLDVATPNGAAKLYRRISNAARRVCPDADSRSLGDKMAAWSCRRQAVNRAVESVSSPAVASLVKRARLASAR
jgi:UrcA family protein